MVNQISNQIFSYMLKAQNIKTLLLNVPYLVMVCSWQWIQMKLEKVKKGMNLLRIKRKIQLK